jgi:predicted RNA-binding protein Jag
VQEAIRAVEQMSPESLEPVVLKDLNAFQRKQVHRHFERTAEYKTKTLRGEGESFVLKVYPVGRLNRLAETKAQEVLMSGEPRSLPPMGSFERFVVHEYIKKRGGLQSESQGEEPERCVRIFPVFGRIPKKAKRRLTR